MSTASDPSKPWTLRLAHFSDVHITVPALGWRRTDWLTKRVTGLVNLRWLGRGKRFLQADAAVAALVAELRRDPPDRVVFSGDATALGFEAEFARAAALLGVNAPDALPGLAVPGNHDYYTPAAATLGLFEKYFAPWQVGERVEGAPYPFAQRVGPAWLVAVNSCTGNRWPMDASGGVGPEQRLRLARLLDRLDPGPRILVTHYPVCIESGAREGRRHCLRDLAEMVEVAGRGGVCLWLHGHRHAPYHLSHPSFAPFPVVCAGSATEEGAWSYSAYTIAGSHFHGVRRVFAPAEGAFRNGKSFEMQLP
jgi:3',5'-cyclic AMP phosphodiesterase CpdA